jgi:hypothetical protein
MEEGGGLVGDLARSWRRREGGLNVSGGLDGALLERACVSLIFDCCLLCRSRLGLNFASSSITRPTSKSSSASGAATLVRSAMAGNFFFMSNIFVKCFAP